jgi:hypothetical protein
MKTILKNGKYERVSDEVAEMLVKKNVATYAPKSEWKKHSRDAERIERDARKQQQEEARIAKKEVNSIKQSKKLKNGK